MRYVLTRDYIWKEVGGDIVVLNLDSGRYFSLNGTASLIWAALMESADVDEIVGRVCSTFDIDPDQAREDAMQLIDEFVANEMIGTA